MIYFLECLIISYVTDEVFLLKKPFKITEQECNNFETENTLKLEVEIPFLEHSSDLEPRENKLRRVQSNIDAYMIRCTALEQIQDSAKEIKIVPLYVKHFSIKTLDVIKKTNNLLVRIDGIE